MGAATNVAERAEAPGQCPYCRRSFTTHNPSLQSPYPLSLITALPTFLVQGMLRAARSPAVVGAIACWGCDVVSTKRGKVQESKRLTIMCMGGGSWRRA